MLRGIRAPIITESMTDWWLLARMAGPLTRGRGGVVGGKRAGAGVMILGPPRGAGRKWGGWAALPGPPAASSQRSGAPAGHAAPARIRRSSSGAPTRSAAAWAPTIGH